MSHIIQILLYYFLSELIILLSLSIKPDAHPLNFPTCTSLQNSMPQLDILYLVDSTVNVGGEENHTGILEFLANFTGKLLKNKLIRFAMVQFTPKPRLEFDFVEAEIVGASDAYIIHQILNAPYTPCIQKPDFCVGNASSLNSIAQWLLLSPEHGNRPNVPDLIVYVRSSLFQLPELNPGEETLIKPQSPIHFFILTIGSSSPNLEAFSPIKFAALNVHLAAVDFDALNDLIDPLCESISGFIGENDKTTFAVTSGLQWTQCLIPLLMLAVCAAILIGTIFYAISHFKQEEERYKRLVKAEQEKLRRLDEYYRRKISERSGYEKERERTMLELIGESNLLKGSCYHDYLAHKRIHPQNYPTLTTRTDTDVPSRDLRKANGKAQKNKKLQRRNSMPDSREGEGQEGVNCKHHYQSGFGERSFCQWCDLKANAVEHHFHQLPFERTLSELPSDHPSLHLPPVDVLFLVDASSSIGNSIYEKIKTDLRELVNEIDIAPGRSRVAIILFANEPHVFIDFNRYYSIQSVRAAIQRMSYLGGGTHLAKALAFAAGFLSQEQNMKDIHIEHKSMPTPHHDRLQLLIVVSDGISDDDFDQQAAHLHERMLVKIAAIVTKKFYKERLRPITRYDGAIFALGQREALSIWLWNQQKLWNEHFGLFVEREKSFQREKSFHAITDRSTTLAPPADVNESTKTKEGNQQQSISGLENNQVVEKHFKKKKSGKKKR